MKTIDSLTLKLSGLIDKINHHTLYSHIRTLPNLRIFMECHVFAVWDFMCLLKELQRRLVSTGAPWFPPRDAQSAHLINGILVEEEGDLSEDGCSYLCHFDLYLQAMQQVGADTQPMQKFLQRLSKGYALREAIAQTHLPAPAQPFVSATFSFFALSTPALAATFVYGREAITSKMFLPLVQQLKQALPESQQSSLSTFIYYCQRHIELDQEDHLPKAMTMLMNLIKSEQDYEDAITAAAAALQARLDFLTSIEQRLKTAVSLP